VQLGLRDEQQRQPHGMEEFTGLRPATHLLVRVPMQTQTHAGTLSTLECIQRHIANTRLPMRTHGDLITSTHASGLFVHGASACFILAKAATTF